LIVVVGLAAAGPLPAQEILLRLRPPQGQVTQYNMVMDMYMQGGPMAQMAADPNAPFMRMTMWMTNTVTAATQDEFTLNQLMDSVRAESPAMPQMSQMFSQVGEMMSGTTTIQRTTSRGRVVGMEVKFTQAMQDMMKAAGANPMAGMGGGNNTNPLQSFWLLPEHPVRVGASWRDSMTVMLDSAGMAGGKVDYAATFTLLRMEGQVAVIGIDGTLITSGAQLPAPLRFALAGDARLDLAGGRVMATTADMTGTVPIMPGTETPMKMHLAITAK
jgi:hypothetical protein